MPDKPHSYTRRAGARPKQTTSESESYSAPKALWVLVIRAMRPSAPVEHHGDEDRGGGGLEPGVHRRDDRVEPREQGGGGEEVGQQVDAAALAARRRVDIRGVGIRGAGIRHDDVSGMGGGAWRWRREMRARKSRSLSQSSAAATMAASDDRANAGRIGREPLRHPDAPRQQHLACHLRPALPPALVAERAHQRIVVRPRPFPRPQPPAQTFQNRIRPPRTPHLVQRRVDGIRTPARKRHTLRRLPVGSIFQQMNRQTRLPALRTGSEDDAPAPPPTAPGSPTPRTASASPAVRPSYGPPPAPRPG